MSSEARAKVCPECATQSAHDSQYCPKCGFPIGAISVDDDDPLIGGVLPGSYQVLDLLGVGGMGRVYRAEQRTLGRTVAVKVIHPHLAADEKSLARFLTEARATSKLNHPNSVSVIDFGKTAAGQPYLVMEFLRGRNLAQVVSTEGLLKLPRIVNVLRQVLAALGEAHALDIIHRDLKPENIVLEPLRRGGDFVKVVDFGLAKLRAEENTTDITLPGIVCGTPDFMAPEQGRGDPLDGRSDIYAVGVVLFWLLTGRLPFEASSPTQVVMMHITMPVPDPRQLAPQRQIPDELVAVMSKALAKDPRERFHDAHEFADALEALELEGGATSSSAPRRRESGESAAALLHLPSKTLSCPACAHVVPHGKFCLECGTRLPQRTERPSSKPRPNDPPLVGREEDLRWLNMEWQRAHEGLRCVRIVGEAGVGKTRLLSEFAEKVRKEGTRVIRLGPDPYWAEVSGHTLKQLVRQLLGPEALEVAPPEHRVVRAVLAELLLGQYSSSLRSDERQAGYAEALRWTLKRTVSEAGPPVVLMIDDLDHVDPLSRQAFGACLKKWNDGPLMAIGAHSPRFNEPWNSDAMRLLSGLVASVASELLNQMMPSSAGFMLTEVGSAGIPPLFVEQMLAFGIDGGAEPPTRLGDLIAERLASLKAEDRRIVQALAVLGDQVPLTLLARFLDVDARTLGPALQGLVEGRLVRQDEGETISLRHPLLHEIALLAIPAEARFALHRTAARLYREDGAPLEVLAEHAAFSRDPVMALSLLEQAATQAEKRGDDLTATNLLSRGLEIARVELFRGELEDPMRALVIFGKKLGATLLRRGHLVDAKGILIEALDSAPPAETDRAEILVQLAEVAQRRGSSEEAERLLAEAQDVAERADANAELLEGLALRRAGLRAARSMT